jgi:hypothetical protein
MVSGRLNFISGSKTNKSSCQLWKKLTFDWLTDNPIQGEKIKKDANVRGTLYIDRSSSYLCNLYSWPSMLLEPRAHKLNAMPCTICNSYVLTNEGPRPLGRLTMNLKSMCQPSWDVETPQLSEMSITLNSRSRLLFFRNRLRCGFVRLVLG